MRRLIVIALTAAVTADVTVAADVPDEAAVEAPPDQGPTYL